MVEMEVSKQIAVIQADLSAALSEWGRRGGRARNPRKGFGTGDNARKAVMARWAKYRAKKALQGD